MAHVEDETSEELDQCPFCAGREDRTPPETLALGRADGAPADTPGWTVRVVPNLYPAFERQEVVVHSPRHVRTFVDLGDDEIELVARAWQLRALAAREDGFAYVHALVNEGRLAGASLAHSHSQLVWMREVPPVVAAERHGECGVCAVLAAEEPLAWRADVVVLSPSAARTPYELLVAPRTHEPEPSSSATADALVLLRESIRRLRAVEGPVPWNAWLHTGDHWHLEVVPRLSVLAGIELGAGIYVNTVAPQDAAAALRAAAP